MTEILPTHGAPAAPKATAPAVTVRPRSHEDSRILDLVEGTTEEGYHYRWVRSRKDENHLAVSRAKLKGYVPVNVKEGVKTVVEPEPRPDGTIAIGDLILMKCKISRYEERIKTKKVRHEQLLASATAETERMAKEKGLALISDPDHGKVATKVNP